MRAEFGKVVIFGVGLIGGSFALALKKARAVEEIVGFGRRPAALQEAVDLGVIHRAGINPAHELGNADLILLATPVGQIPQILESIAPYLSPHTIITDGGSTKADVVIAARSILKHKAAQFVPAHPIAGSENSGPAAARPDLYEGRKVIVTPMPENSDETLDRVKRAWSLCGAEIYELDPVKHDEVFAAVSHLPHLLAFALVEDLARREDVEVYFKYAGSGFRDFTRIAASHPEMWRDICIANRRALIVELERYQSRLDNLRMALVCRDDRSLDKVFGYSSAVRRAWGSKFMREEEHE